MTKDKALELTRELEEMIGDGPGDYHGCLRRIEEIQFQLNSIDNSYVREKATEATGYLSIWRSPRKWQQWGNDHTHLGSIVRKSVAGLRRAVNTNMGSK